LLTVPRHGLQCPAVRTENLIWVMALGSYNPSPTLTIDSHALENGGCIGIFGMRLAIAGSRPLQEIIGGMRP